MHLKRSYLHKDGRQSGTQTDSLIIFQQLHLSCWFSSKIQPVINGANINAANTNATRIRLIFHLSLTSSAEPEVLALEILINDAVRNAQSLLLLTTVHVCQLQC